MINQLQEINFFTLKPRPTKTLPQSELFFKNTKTDIIIDGITLEKQFSLQGKYLLFITENSPYEEGLHIYVLDHELKILDSLEVSAPYSPGILINVQVKNKDTVTFSFFDNDLWELQLVSIPFRKLNIPTFNSVKYKGGLYSHHWLKINRIIFNE